MSSPRRHQHLARELYEQAGQACTFTICCALRTAPFTDVRYARVAVDCLLRQQAKSSCHLFVYCVMPNHVHLIVTPDAAGYSTLTYVDRYKGWTGRELRLAGWRGDLWQARSYDHLVRRDEDLLAIARYILANPVRAGLVSSPNDYPWSGILNPTL